MYVIANEKLSAISGGDGGDLFQVYEHDSLTGALTGGVGFNPAAIPIVAAVGGLAAGVGYVFTTDKPTISGGIAATLSGALGAVVASFGGILPTLAGAVISTGGSVAAPNVLK